MEQVNNATAGQPEPVTLGAPSGDMINMPDCLCAEINQRFGLDRDTIESVFPFGHVVCEVPADLDPQRLMAAWKKTVRQTPALRAYIFTSKDGDSFQLVLKDTFVFSRLYWTSPSLKAAVVKDEAAAAIAGPRCNRLVLLDDPDTKKQLLIWTFSHAFVDSAFRARIFRGVLAAYNGDGQLDSLPVTPASCADTEEESLGLANIPQVPDMERTKQFWKDQLNGLDASVFPHLSSHLTTPDANAQTEHRITYPSSTQHRWPSTTVCRAALAILLSRYTHSSEALFGVVAEQSHKFEEHRPFIDGPTRAVMPFRVRFAPGQSVLDFMKAITAYDHDMRQFAHVGLRNIRRIGDDQTAACEFQTVLLVTDRDASQAAAAEILQTLEESESFVPCANRALLLRCETTADDALLAARYDPSVIEPLQMTRFLRQLGGLIEQLQSATSGVLCVGQLDTVTSEDREEIESWNSDLLRKHDVLIHSKISKWVDDSPSSPAVCSWDGSWTYSELDEVSSRLAAHIKSGPGQKQLIIPVYFEKSKWVVASILAVLKAGHAFTLIDPKDPPARTNQIAQQTSTTLALTSKLHYNTVQATMRKCLVVDDDLLQSLPSICDQTQSGFTATPHDLAYVIFTSGSTGNPKGIMIEHRAFASCVVEFGPALGIHSGTRALQFSSHGFGACLLETLTTLIHGGCVCIPSDYDRMHNIPDFVKRAQINWMMVTPSYATTFEPEDVPGLRTLVLVGEPMSASINNTWASRLQLLDGYGQSESSSVCFIGKINPLSSEPNNIGRAVGAHAWIVHPEDPDRLAPVGAIGELLIESPGIARGYIAAPMTDKVPFLETPPDWYAPRQLPHGVKFYKTGDLARYAADGTIVCLGRVDSQVKIRGQRVEMGAVETCLRQYLPSDVTVVAEAVNRSSSSSSAVITAFLICSSTMENNDSIATSAEDARILDQDATQVTNTKLAHVLPPYSIPSCYISIKALPRTATGKVDRRRLRSIGSNLLAQQTQETSSQPLLSRNANWLATSPEAKLEEVWIQIFNPQSSPMNAGASFFELGGDSISAIKMVNMARAAGIELKISDVFQNPTLTRLQAAIRGSSTPFTFIQPSTWNGPVDQSYSQGRLWFLDQLDIGSLWYLIPFAVRMRGPLHIDALTRALAALEQRHETLRTTFENRDGAGVQIVHEKLAKELRIIHVPDSDDGYAQALAQEQTTPFDLTSEAGWRASLICVGEGDNILSIVMHHIISDGWSIDVLRRELGQLYAAALRDRDLSSAVSPLPVQYRDFSMWQKQESQALEHERQLQYWKKQLADCSPAKLPTDFPRPTLLSGEARVVPVTITGELFQKLQEFCHQLNTTFFVVLLATFRAAHYRLTGADDAVIGTPIANRNRRELENLIGFFVNTQCMRITIDEEDTFDGLVGQVRSTTTTAFEHEDVPFERVVSAMLPGSRDLSQNPLAQLIFAIHSQTDLGKFELEGLESEPVATKPYTRFDAEFHLFQSADGLTGYLNFAAELFKPETMQNVVSVFLQILRGGLDQPQSLVSVLPLTDGLEELRDIGLKEISRVEYQRDSSIVDIFRAQAATFPYALAVIDSSSRLTYAELDHQSDLLETWLRRHNLPAEALVGVLSPRSCETVIAFLGILKANLAYLPLDTGSPATRIRDILSTLPKHTIVMLGSEVASPDLQLPGLELQRISDALEPSGVNGVSGHEHPPATYPTATSLAYVLFTSGSTGRPKGVMVEHRVIVRLVRHDVIADFPPAQGAIMSHLFNTVFDGATYEIFLMLLNGGTLVCVDYMTTLSPKALEAVIEKEKVNSAIMTPALLKTYLADAPGALKGLDMLMVAGDRLDPQDAIAAQTLVRGQCYNAYGPTENGVMSTLYKIDTKDSFINGVPLGRAISNSGAYITDPNLQLVGPGVMGELVVTGDGLARGYTDQGLDKNRFVQLTIDGHTVRAYRTGDRMRYRVGEGVLEFFGRMDLQFKIRSNRIESAEVEAAMLSHPLVRDAAVVLRVEEERQPEIVGFVVAENDTAMEQQETADHVERWQDLMERNVYADIDTLSASAIGKDFTGWTSIYDGSEIDQAEMQEWLADTIETLLDGQLPGHVLEIGTGTGMILFNLGPGLQNYVGLEPTKSATAFVNNAIQSIPALAGKVEVHIGTARDIQRLNRLHPDIVVLNSVVQYFPSAEYLAQVVDTLVRIDGVKRLFFGDVRSQATDRHFLAARAIHVLGQAATRDDVQTRMAELEEREEELLVEPAFFTALARRLPDLVRHVEIIPKNMRATNELSAYRYAAVVHLRGSEAVARPVHPIATDDWVDFRASRMHRDALREYLRLSENATTVCVSNIPCRRTIFERLIVESLDGTNNDAQHGALDGAAWISAVRSDAESRAALSVPDLMQLAEESGFRVEVSAARQRSQGGALDAVFHRDRSSARALFRFPTDDDIQPSAALTNRPLQRLQKQRVAGQVRERLQGLIPSYMIPAHIVALERMPLNASGKVDRKELTRRARRIQTPQKPAPVLPVLPIGDVEAVLCEEAAATFGMEVSITNHFFQMGGHSLLASRLIARVGDRLKARLTVKDVFDHPVLSELAVVIRQGLALRNAIPAGGGQVKQGSSAGAGPRTEMESMLCEEFARVLGMHVGVTDNFFDIGGHSLMASKLAARIGHRLDTTISVRDVFNHPVLFQLAATLELAQSKSYKGAGDVDMPNYTAFQLLSVPDPQDFVHNEICSRLGFSYGKVQDVYPATHMQKTFLCDAATGRPKPLVPFYVDFPACSDPDDLVRACSSLVERFDIFRTVFVEVAGEFYQVVLEHLDLTIDVIETEENVHAATSDFVDKVAEEPIHLGRSLIRASILKQASSVRVLLRLSHALYDGLSLEHVVRDLHMLYERKSLLPANQFSRYIQYVAQARKDGRDFWRDVIQDSAITVLSDASRDGCDLEPGAARALHASKIVDMSPQAARSSTITPATVFNAACALMLSRETGSQDVVFGRIVSGRQGLPVRWQSMVGPCTNAVPVRVRVDGDRRRMLRDMQDQYLLSLPFEALGFDEVRRSCYWPETATDYGCCVTYHDFSYRPASELGAQRVEMGVLAKKAALRREEPVYDLGVAGEVEPDGGHLQVTVVAKARLFSEERAAYLLEEVCKTFESLNSSVCKYWDGGDGAGN